MAFTYSIESCSACILDFDDTVARTFEVRSASLIEVLSGFGHIVTRSEIARKWGAPFPMLIESLAPGLDSAGFLERYKKVMSAHPPRLAVGAQELISELSSLHKPCIVHSSSLTELVIQDLRSLGLEQAISAVFGSDRTVYAKPDPKSLLVALRWLEDQGYEQQDALYIGDSVSDLEVARGNAVPFIAVLSGRTTAADFQAAGFDGPIVASLLNLLGQGA